MLFEQARREARQLDEYFSKHKQVKGPLHGVPVSFKDVCKYPVKSFAGGHSLEAMQMTSPVMTPQWAIQSSLLDLPHRTLR